MRQTRIFVDAPVTVGEPVPLDDRAARHAIRVLRLRPGDELILFNGRGGEYEARLTSAKRDAPTATPERFIDRDTESPLPVTLIQGISRGDRMDYTIQKAVELGVRSIRPVFTKRTVVKLAGTRKEKRVAHWRGVAVAACEQSGRTRPPEILPPTDLERALGAAGENTRRILLDPAGERSLPSLGPPDGGLWLLAGPEGGLAEAERRLAGDYGFRGITLGPRILRTETAAVACLALIQGLWGDLGPG